MSSLLNGTTLTPMQEESMKMILASGDLLLAIVNDVLDYTKLETDHVELNVARNDLQDMLQSVLYSIEIKAKARGQSIRAIYDPNLPVLINTDIRRIQQVLFNLLGNAIKFSKENGVVELEVSYGKRKRAESVLAMASGETVSVIGESSPKNEDKGRHDSDSMAESGCPFHTPKSTPQSDGAVDRDLMSEEASKAKSSQRHSSLFHRQYRTLQFVVTDYGKGIKRSEFEAIFRPFQQDSVTATNAQYGGTGLGLAITKKLVTALGGTIAVDSEEGSWSKFTVELPCSDHPAPIEDLSKQMNDTTILISGLPSEQRSNLARIFGSFSIDVRFADSADNFAGLLSKQGDDSISTNRRILFLVHGDVLTLPWMKAFAELKKRRKEELFLFTFASHGPKAIIGETQIVHHIRSLEQMIPQSLIELLNEKSAVNVEVANFSPVKKGTSDDKKRCQSLRILIAEDNKVNQKVLLRMLRRLGVESVDIVENGLDAVNKEKSTRYDLILMDASMPVMGGIPACRLILGREHSTHPAPLVVFVTAHVSAEFQRECKEAGSTLFLPKPFKIADIDTCLRNVVEILETKKEAMVQDHSS